MSRSLMTIAPKSCELRLGGPSKISLPLKERKDVRISVQDNDTNSALDLKAQSCVKIRGPNKRLWQAVYHKGLRLPRWSWTCQIIRIPNRSAVGGASSAMTAQHVYVEGPAVKYDTSTKYGADDGAARRRTTGRYKPMTHTRTNTDDS